MSYSLLGRDYIPSVFVLKNDGFKPRWYCSLRVGTALVQLELSSTKHRTTLSATEWGRTQWVTTRQAEIYLRFAKITQLRPTVKSTTNMA
jgi:hypothetical protein